MTFQKLLPNASPVTHSIWLRHPFQTKFYLPPHRFPFALQLSFQLQLSSNILFQSQFSLSFVTSITDFNLATFYTADFIWHSISITIFIIICFFNHWCQFNCYFYWTCNLICNFQIQILFSYHLYYELHFSSYFHGWFHSTWYSYHRLHFICNYHSAL